MLLEILAPITVLAAIFVGVLWTAKPTRHAARIAREKASAKPEPVRVPRSTPTAAPRSRRSDVDEIADAVVAIFIP